MDDEEEEKRREEEDKEEEKKREEEDEEEEKRREEDDEKVCTPRTEEGPLLVPVIKSRVIGKRDICYMENTREAIFRSEQHGKYKWAKRKL